MAERQVDWLEWGEEAFRRARAEDKPILLSLVVSWDQWCRLMERDTYGDPHVALVLNRDYVPVRVDADRRPDVNERYNVGGWPSTVFLTPDGDLLWGAASIPPDQMKQVLVRLREGFAAQRARLAEAIRSRDEKVARAMAGLHEGQALLGEDIVRRTLRGIVRTYDPAGAGFGPPPKFPMTASLRLLVEALFESGGEEFRGILERTLDAVGWRGLYDSVEGGFHRFCAHEGWTAPRTEKLTADNAGLIRLYLEAGQVMEEPRYHDRARDVAAWAVRVMRDPERRVFAASQAADDEYFALPREARRGRTAPAVDRTIIVETNAEMASALLRAAAVLADESLAGVARGALEAVLTECRDPRLGAARYHDGRPGGYGLMRDHAFLSRALLDAYEYSADRRYLAEAERLIGFLWESFWDGGEQGLLDRRPGFEEFGELRVKRKNIQENSVACETALRLAAHTGDPGWRRKAGAALAGFPDYGEDYGHHTAEYAAAVGWLVRPATEITIVAPASGGWVEAMRAIALGAYVPRRVVRWYDPEVDRAAVEARGFPTADGSRAFVERGGKRMPPARTPSELAQRLRRL